MTNEAMPFDEALKALSQFGIGTGMGLQPSELG